MLSERDIGYVARRVCAGIGNPLVIYLSPGVPEFLTRRGKYSTSGDLLDVMNAGNPIARIEVAPSGFSKDLLVEGFPVHPEFAEILYPLELTPDRQVVQASWATPMGENPDVEEYMAMILEHTTPAEIGERTKEAAVCTIRMGFNPSNDPPMTPKLHSVTYRTTQVQNASITF